MKQSLLPKTLSTSKSSCPFADILLSYTRHEHGIIVKAFLLVAFRSIDRVLVTKSIERKRQMSCERQKLFQACHFKVSLYLKSAEVTVTPDLIIANNMSPCNPCQAIVMITKVRCSRAGK